MPRKHSSRNATAAGLITAGVILSHATVSAQCEPGWVTTLGQPGFNQSVVGLHVLPSGELLAFGAFTASGGTPVGKVALWNGAQWVTLGEGLVTSAIYAAATLSTGELIVSGEPIDLPDSVGETRLAIWNGARWRSVLHGPVNGDVQELALTANGGVLAGGNFTKTAALPCNKIARWDGQAWSCLGSTQFFQSGTVGSIVPMPGGDVIAAGGLPGYVRRWNGATWLTMGTGLNAGVHVVAHRADGDLIAGGFFDTSGGGTANYLARLEGSTWTTFAGGTDAPVIVLRETPSGDLLAGGGFSTAGGVAANRVARWDGAGWHGLGSGVDGGWVAGIALLPGGDIAVAGTFTSAGGQPANYVAVYVQNPQAPTASISSMAASVCGASPAVLSVSSLGTEPLSYGWEAETAPGVWQVIGPQGLQLPCGATLTAAPHNGRPAGISVQRCAGVGRYQVRAVVSNPCGVARSDAATITVHSADFDNDGADATGADIQAFFACLAGDCCPTCGTADFDGDGDTGTDADIEAFFRVLAGGAC